MRMYNIDPSFLCRKHLLGEHVELHMMVGSIKNGKPSVSGWARAGLLDTYLLNVRHTAVSEEMLRRGYKHESPLDDDYSTVHEGRLNLIQDLSKIKQCPECKKMRKDYDNAQWVAYVDLFEVLSE